MFGVFAQLCKQSEWIMKTKWKRDKTSNCKWEKIQRREKSKEPTGLKTIMTKARRLSSLMLCFHTVACQDKHRVHDRANTWDCMPILQTTLHHVTSHGENNPVSVHLTEPVSGPRMILPSYHNIQRAILINIHMTGFTIILFTKKSQQTFSAPSPSCLSDAA